MAKPSKFAHVVYSTRRFDEMVDWYLKVFEAKVRISKSGVLPFSLTTTNIIASRSPTYRCSVRRARSHRAARKA